MKKIWFKRLRVALLTLTVLGGIFYVPWFFQEKPVYFDPAGIMAPKRAKHQGVLTLWALGGWNTPYGSRTTLLKDAARRYERLNIGSYVEVVQLDNEQFLRLLEKGQRPDLISIPAGFAYELPWQFSEQNDYALRDPFSSCDGFVPWIASGKVLLWNLQLCEKMKLPTEIPESSVLLEALSQTNEKEPLLYAGGVSWLAPLRVGEDWQTYLKEKAPLDALYAQAWPQFRAGSCAYYIGGYYERNILNVLQGKNSGFAYGQGWPSDWQMPLDVHFIGIVSDSEVHDEACRKYMDILLSERTQQDVIHRLGCIPVIGLDTETLNASERETYAQAEDAYVLPAGIALDGKALYEWTEK